MIIGIDASRANREPKTGTEWYAYHLIEALKKIASADWQVRLYTGAPLKGALAVLPANFSEARLRWPPKYLWTQWRLWRELRRNPPDILLVPAHTIPFLPLKKSLKVAVTVHDVGFKRFPKLYKKIQVFYHDLTMKRIRGRADLVITDSEFSRREIMGFYGVPSEKIKVIYLGYDRAQYNLAAAGKAAGEIASVAALPEKIAAVLRRYQVAKPYLLYVGRLEKKKNILGLLRAFILAKKTYPELKLVLAGSGGNYFHLIKRIIAETKTAAEVILPGYVAEADLPALIGQAAVFMFPTLYEGFGLPIIQAMACGTPVITSDLEPHREIAGDAAALVPPLSPKQIAEEILELCFNEKVAAERRQKGLARAAEFSWEKTAKETWAAIEALTIKK